MPANSKQSLAQVPRVYLDYTQAELDAAYDQRIWAPNREEIVRWYGEESAKVRAGIDHRRGVPYGNGEDETLDIFPAKAGSESTSSAPIHVHVHGGRWTLFSKDEESFIAPTFVNAGAVCVVIGFSNIPKVRIPDMVDQVKRAIAWIYANAESFGGDPERIHLSAHSSGSHLAGVALLTDWKKDFGLPADIVKSALLISGMYDMRPVILSARSSYVKLSGAEILDLSAILQAEKFGTPATLVYGEQETPEFRRQPREFAEVLESIGKPVRLVEIPGVNHFEVLKMLGDPASAVSRLALGLMALD
jgi:arylformamidase